MKFVVYARYTEDKSRVHQARPAHRIYANRLMSAGKLVAAGPFADGSGGLFIYDVGNREEVDALVRADPYVTLGAFAFFETKPWAMAGAIAEAFQVGSSA
jgi:uncharacterized protein YciI